MILLPSSVRIYVATAPTQIRLGLTVLTRDKEELESAPAAAPIA